MVKGILKADIDPAWLLRIFTVIPIVLILLAGGAAIWIYFFVLSLLPQGESLIETPGLSSDVRVVRDGNGVPGIIGKTEEDVALVFGYTMAQDRLWQMDYLRRAGQGRLAEVLGADYLEGDHLIRCASAGLPESFESNKLGDREGKWLENFVRGVNKYISRHAKKPPVEFSLLEYRPRPFSTEDVMSIVLALAWNSSAGVRVDPIMTDLLGRLGKERALPLFPTDPAAPAPLVCSDLEGWIPKGGLFSDPAVLRSSIRFPGLRGGSAWVLGGSRTRSGKPMAVCSAYQALNAPGFWYRARLAAGDFQVSGFFVPGVPVALAGSNSNVAWSSISAPVDDADLYIERFNSNEPETYWRVDRPRKVRRVNENYRVKGGSSISRTILLTDTGPLVSDVYRGRALSIRWTAREGLGLCQAFFAVNRAGNGQEVRAALEKLKAPCLNVVWADVKGGYGTQTAGLIPVRPPDSDGIVPMPGWTGVHDWVGFIPSEDLPAANNPSRGLAVVTEGRPGGPDYPLFVSTYWHDDSKRARIEKLLGESKEHFRESVQKIQADSVSMLAESLTPVILKAIEGHPMRNRSQQEALRILGQWNYEMGRDSAAAAVFGLVYRALTEEILLTPLGESLYEAFTSYPPLTSRILKKVFVNRSQWPGISDPQAVLAKCFQKAVSSGISLMGDDPSKWKWGDIHQTEFRHPLTARSKFLEALYHVGPVPAQGSQDTIDFAAWWPAHPYRVVEGVAFRQIADMTDPPQIFGVSPLGISAHFFSTHYKDQTRAWLLGRSFRDPMQVADIQKSGFSTVIFRPGPAAAVSMK